ncbi:MAG TPA: hypothetical protein VIY68_18890 [Steroidobacteraceae bacterium]
MQWRDSRSWTSHNPGPPAPDIKAILDGHGAVNFELVDLTDDEELKRFNLMPESFDLVVKFHESLDIKQ